jgi:hypothetical protein
MVNRETAGLRAGLNNIIIPAKQRQQILDGILDLGRLMGS